MNRFKELRKQKGITQIELAQTLGVKQTTVSKWEVDKATPDYSTLIKLAEFYGVSADYLLMIENDNTFIKNKKIIYVNCKEEKIINCIREIEKLGDKNAIKELLSYLIELCGKLI